MIKEQLKNEIKEVVESPKMYILESIDAFKDTLGEEIRISIDYKKPMFRSDQSIKKTNRKLVEGLIDLLANSELQNYKLRIFIFERRKGSRRWKLRFSTKIYPIKKLKRFRYAGMVGLSLTGIIDVQEK